MLQLIKNTITLSIILFSTMKLNYSADRLTDRRHIELMATFNKCFKQDSFLLTIEQKFPRKVWTSTINPNLKEVFIAVFERYPQLAVSHILNTSYLPTADEIAALEPEGFVETFDRWNRTYFKKYRQQDQADQIKTWITLLRFKQLAIAENPLNFQSIASDLWDNYFTSFDKYRFVRWLCIRFCLFKNNFEDIITQLLSTDEALRDVVIMVSLETLPSLSSPARTPQSSPGSAQPISRIKPTSNSSGGPAAVDRHHSDISHSQESIGSVVTGSGTGSRPATPGQ